MQRIFFATGGSEFTGYAGTTTPSNWYFSPSTDTTSTFNEFQNGNWAAVFVYWSNPTGTTGNFNAEQFIQQVRSWNNTTPIFLIVPTSYSNQAPTWQTMTDSLGYVTWDGTNFNNFTQQVQEILQRYRVVAA